MGWSGSTRIRLGHRSAVLARISQKNQRFHGMGFISLHISGSLACVRIALHRLSSQGYAGCALVKEGRLSFILLAIRVESSHFEDLHDAAPSEYISANLHYRRD
jgi:hypothetical protein